MVASVASIDPVFEALGLAHAGYLPNPLASPMWTAYAQCVSMTSTTTATACTMQSPIGRQEASQRAIPMSSNSGSSLSQCMLPPPPPPPLIESPLRSSFDMNLPQTPDVKRSSVQEASPLVLPDVLPAESRQSCNSCRSLGESVSTEASEALWHAVSPTGQAQEPPMWPTMSWDMCDLNIGTGITAAYPRSVGVNLPCLATDVSMPWPTEGQQAPDTGSPTPTTPSVSNSDRQLRGQMHETPPPPPLLPRWTFRAEAPCFVPKGIDRPTMTIIDVLNSTQGTTPENDSKQVRNFIESRARMLRLRPTDTPKRELSAIALQVAKAAFVSGRAPTPPPPNIPPPLETHPRVEKTLERPLGKGSGSRGTHRGGKAEARGQIRASAAGARAQFGFPARVARNSQRHRGRCDEYF